MYKMHHSTFFVKFFFFNFLNKRFENQTKNFFRQNPSVVIAQLVERSSLDQMARLQMGSRGQIFFLFFLMKYDNRCHLVVVICIIKALVSMYAPNYG